MSKRSTSHFAVLMGDLVASEAARSPARVHAVFNDAVAWAEARHGSQIASPLTITLGDEFQGLLHTLEQALSAAVDLRFKLMEGGIACRFVVGLVRLETPVNPERAWNMMGHGLSAARTKLNDKDSPNAHRFSLPDDPAVEVLADAVGQTLTNIESGWSDAQRDYFLRRHWRRQSAVEIAGQVGVTKSAVYKVLSAAQDKLYDAQLTALRTALASLDKQYGLS